MSTRRESSSGDGEAASRAGERGRIGGDGERGGERERKRERHTGFWVSVLARRLRDRESTPVMTASQPARDGEREIERVRVRNYSILITER
jgi:hypothetical protein